MIALTTAEIAELCGGHTAADARVTGVSIDSRAVSPGDLFVALPGTRTDGVRFVAAALAAGAAAALVGGTPGDVPADDGSIVVADPLIALGQVAAEVRRRSAARVVGVTGSTGKTSTKDILAALLRGRLATVASHANFNTEIGVPLTLCRIEAATEAVVCELAMRGMGQVAYLAEIARPDVAVITSVGPVHLEQVGTVERVAEAKAEILQPLRPGDTAVVPCDEPLLEPYVEMCRARIVTFGTGAGADVRLAGFASGRAEIALGGRTITVPVNFDQPHNGENLAAAVAACVGLGLDPAGPELLAGAAHVELSRWRGERHDLDGGGFVIADCYNANPVSMRAALRHLAAVADGRRTVAVIGEMAELGPAGPELHAQIGREAEGLGVDVVVAVGELSRAYGGRWYADAAAAAAGAPEIVRPGDAVLVKASRSAGLEAVVEALT
ncbi:MAG TPA: UDP-N-acetylmuramoyl-tripeptide--D-alanyl-D-alanine ligase [Gaiellales bacterium]